MLCIVITFYGSSKLVTVERWTTYWLPAVCRAGWLPPTSFLTCMLAYLTYSTVIRTITHDHAGHFFLRVHFNLLFADETFSTLKIRTWTPTSVAKICGAVRPLLFV